MRVTFLEDAKIKVEGQTEVVFREGATEDLAVASALRWIRRGVAAEAVVEPTPKKATSRKKSTAKR